MSDMYGGMPQQYGPEGNPLPYNQYGYGNQYAMFDGTLTPYPQGINPYSPVLDPRVQTVAQFQMEQMYRQDMQRRMLEGVLRQPLSGIALPPLPPHSDKAPSREILLERLAELETKLEVQKFSGLVDSVINKRIRRRYFRGTVSAISETYAKFKGSEISAYQSSAEVEQKKLISFYFGELPAQCDVVGKHDEYIFDGQATLPFYTVQSTEQSGLAADKRQLSNYMSIFCSNMLLDDDSPKTKEQYSSKEQEEYSDYWLLQDSLRDNVSFQKISINNIGNETIDNLDSRDRVKLAITLGNIIRDGIDIGPSAGTIAKQYIYLINKLKSSDSRVDGIAADDELSRTTSVVWDGQSDPVSKINRYLRLGRPESIYDEGVLYSLINIDPVMFELFGPRPQQLGDETQAAKIYELAKSNVTALEEYDKLRSNSKNITEVRALVKTIDSITRIMQNMTYDSVVTRFMLNDIHMTQQEYFELVQNTIEIIENTTPEETNRLIPTILEQKFGSVSSGKANLARSKVLLTFVSMYNFLPDDTDNYGEDPDGKKLTILWNNFADSLATSMRSLDNKQDSKSSVIKDWAINAFADYYWGVLMPKLNKGSFEDLSTTNHKLFVNFLKKQQKKKLEALSHTDPNAFKKYIKNCYDNNKTNHDLIVLWAITRAMPEVIARGPFPVPVAKTR